MRSNAVVVVAAVGMALGAGCSSILGLDEPRVGELAGTDDGGGGGDDDDGDATPPADATPGPDASTRDVVGTSRLSLVLLDGTTEDVPEDLSAYTLQAYVPDPEEPTGFRVIDGQGTADGTFVIPDVPHVTYYLKTIAPGAAWPEYFVTGARVVDLGHSAPGRDAPSPTRGLPITLDLDGMSPWAAGDRLEVGSTSVATTWTDKLELPEGTTALASYQLDWQTAGGPLIRGTVRLPRLIEAGRDDLHVLHWGASTIEDNRGDALAVEAIEDAFATDAITLRDGEAAAVGGRFSPVAFGNRQTVAVDGAAFEAAFGDDGATVDRELGIIRGVSPTLADNPDGVQTILRFTGAPRLSGGIRTFSSSYGNPFPASWDQVLMTQYVRKRAVIVPGARYFTWCYSYSTVTLPAVPNFTARPYVAAVSNVTIGGADGQVGGGVAFDRRGLELTWDAVDRADYYGVRVYHVHGENNTTRRRFMSDLFTAGTSLTIPAELLLDGELYVFGVTSYRGNPGYAAGALRVDGMPSGWTRSCTATVRVSSTCGDGDVDTGETCDAGEAGSATCDTDCTPAVCSDGLHNPHAGEVCDAVEDSDACDDDCTAVVCGDGHLNLMREDCDDGNTADGDTCSADCQVATVSPLR